MKSTQAQTATAGDATNSLLSHSFIHSFTTSFACTCTHKYSTSHNLCNL